MQKIIPHLWFDHNAEEAVTFYTQTFRNGEVGTTVRYPEAGREVHGMEAGSVLTMTFKIEDYELVALNGGPAFTPTPSISFFVDRKEKEEIDGLWEKLSLEGKTLMPLQSYDFSPYYGWVQDRFGISWQLMLSPEGEPSPLMPSFLFTGKKAQADEAIDFYLSVFKDSKRGVTHKYEDMGVEGRPGHVAYADFFIEGQKFAAMDGGPDHAFTFNEGISLMVTCKDQDEIDYYWERLSSVPEAEQCGWLKDKFGVSWQIIPSGMDEALNNADKEKANRAMEAMLKMRKIDIQALEDATEGR